MADPIESEIGIFDDFDEAAEMDTTYCRQVSDDQYQEDIRSETDKALGDLCLYLDKNPDIYARVLRKRKQEEMEKAGVVSFMKSKVMSLIHGEQYPQCLVSTSECLHQTNALKSGMCKTFQLSQELKGNTTRHSARLAAKRQAQMAQNYDDDNQASASSGENSQAKTNSEQNSHNSSEASGQLVPDYANNSPAILVATIIPSVQSPTRKSFSQAGDPAIDDFNESSTEKGNMALDKQSTGWGETLGFSHPPPPPAPPLPPSMLTSTTSKTSVSQSALTIITNTPAKKTRRSLTKTHPYDTIHHRQPRTSPRKSVASRENSMTRSTSAHNLSSLSRPGSAASMDGPFLTPMVPPLLKSHKRTLSNSSVDSTSSCGSFNSIHSELMSSNPVTRLRSTPVIRSPGGTPLRSKSDLVPTEPLHKALFLAVKSKFKNVQTPSPASGKTSLNNSKASTQDSTFSP